MLGPVTRCRGAEAGDMKVSLATTTAGPPEQEAEAEAAAPRGARREASAASSG